MKYLKGIYDSSQKKMMIEFNNSLLENHFDLFEDCVKEGKSNGLLPKDLEVEDLGEGKCLIIFHIDLPDGDKEGRIGSLPKEMTENLVNLIDNFRNKALKKEFSTTEFIPLTGYPLENLQKDILEAIRGKRDFCIIDKYSEYLNFSSGKTTKMKQKKVKYLSDEYSNTAIYIYEGNMKRVKDLFKDQLSLVDWE